MIGRPTQDVSMMHRQLDVVHHCRHIISESFSIIFKFPHVSDRLSRSVGLISITGGWPNVSSVGCQSLSCTEHSNTTSWDEC